MIESEVTKHIWTIGKLKDDSVYLLNDARRIFQYRPLEHFAGDDNKIDEKIEIVGKRKYEQAVSTSNKLRIFVKTVVGRNITVL